MTFYYPFPEKPSNIIYNCDKCELDKRGVINNPHFVPIIGKAYNGLVILGQNISKEDDQKGVPFSNKTALTIRSTAFRNKVNLNTQAAFIYALNCRGTGTDVQFKCCRKNMAEWINTLKPKPKMIICCGEMAFKSLFDLKTKIAPTKLRNRIIPNYEFNCVVFTMLNPNDVRSREYEYALRKDMERAIKYWNTKFYIRKNVDAFLAERKILENVTIKTIKNPDELYVLLHLLKNVKEIALDFETTNVKPYDDYFNITHIQFGNATNAWVLHEDLWKKYPIWPHLKLFMTEFLTNPNIKKIIQNSKFEDLCSRWAFGIKSIVNTECTMLATHTIDERGGCTSLDFQNLTRFGIPPYSDTVKSFLKKKNKDDKTNSIREAPYDDLILYAGLDVITTYNNWKLIEKIFTLNKEYPKARENYEFLKKGHWLFGNMSQRGIVIGQNELNGLENIFKSYADEIMEKIESIPEVIDYNKYLEDKVNLKKKGDSKLKQISKSRTNNGTGNVETIGQGNKRGKKKIPVKIKLRRNLQF